jgi:hypothetical protein
MLMRYHFGLGVGHVHSHTPAAGASNSPADGLDEHVVAEPDDKLLDDDGGLYFSGKTVYMTTRSSRMIHLMNSMP